MGTLIVIARPRTRRPQPRLSRPAQFENEDEVAEYFKRRYATGEYDDAAGRGGAVDQQALLPSASDPSVWAVAVKPGKEQDVCLMIMRKAVMLARKGEPLAIKSIYRLDARGLACGPVFSHSLLIWFPLSSLRGRDGTKTCKGSLL